MAQPPEDLYGQAVAARHSGDPARSAELLARVIAAEPSNADARLQLGLALLALDRIDEAEAAFRHTLQLAPDYADARIGLARVAQRRGDRSAALAILEGVDASSTEAQELRASLVEGPSDRRRVRLEYDFTFSDLEEPRSDWTESRVQLRYEVTDDVAVTGLAEVSDRGADTDVYGELRFDTRLAPGSGVYIALGATPNADFRPRWQLSAGGFARIRSGPNATVLTLDGRQSHFAAGDIQMLTAGVEQYLAGASAWLTGRWINIFDENGNHHSGWLARGDVMANARLRLFAGLADAPDTSEGVVIDTFSLFGGLSYDLSPGMTLRLSVAHEDRDVGSDRLQLSAGTALRF
jgi:YaiO family outer membrane protein